MHIPQERHPQRRRQARREEVGGEHRIRYRNGLVDAARAERIRGRRQVRARRVLRLHNAIIESKDCVFPSGGD